MTKLKMLQAVKDKYDPLIAELENKVQPMTCKLIALKVDYQSKLEQIETYFDALDKIKQLQGIINNPPEV